MKILAIHRYYWPDSPPYASILRMIVARWAQDGHDVSVLSSQPSYKVGRVQASRPKRDHVDGVAVARLAMKPDRTSSIQRLLNFVRFPLVAGWRVLTGPQRDVVMCSTAPQVLLGVLVSLAARARRSTFVYHCMDLHPEIGALSGEFANPFVFRLLAAIDTATCRRAAVVVVLSEDMRRSLERRDPRLGERIVVLNNFELPSFEETSEVNGCPPQAPGKVRIAFAGNVGRFQGLELLVEAMLADEAALDGVELVIMGEGVAKADLEHIVSQAPPHRRERVHFLPHGSPAAARALLAVSDHGLVSLAPRVIEFAYPSKTATYLSEGLPLLMMVEPDSDLARMADSEGVGRCLPTEPSAMGRVLLEIASAGRLTEERRGQVRACWSNNFSADRQLPRWSALMTRIEQERHGTSR